MQKIEEPVRSNFPEGSDSGAQNFGPKQGEADDFLKSKTANPDTEVFGTEVGLADAMRFKGAGDLHFLAMNLLVLQAKRQGSLSFVMQLLRSSTPDLLCLALWQLSWLRMPLARMSFSKHRQSNCQLLWLSSPLLLLLWFQLFEVYQEKATASSQLMLSFGTVDWWVLALSSYCLTVP